MPAHRKPTNVLALNGSLRRNPGRHADRLVEPTPRGPVSNEPPVTMSAIEAICWREIIAKCPAGVLGNSDEPLLELASKLLAAVRYGEPADLSKHAPLLIKTLGLLGMSPADRSRVKAAVGPRAPSPLDEFDD